MASSTNAKDIVTFNIGNNPITFQITEEESLKTYSSTNIHWWGYSENLATTNAYSFCRCWQTHCFPGSYPDTKMQTKNIQIHFLGFTLAIPPAFEKDGSIDVKFMDSKARVFRSMPTPGNKEYVAWLNKVQHKCQEQWKMIGTFDAIQISRDSHRINPCMLLALMYF